MMIDEKKIEEAAEKYADNITQSNTGWDWYDHAEYGFKEGAHWAIEQFLKDLWHEAKEEPPRYDDYLVKTKQGCIDSCLFSNGVWFQPKIGGGEVAMWLDYKDILPKQKGGEDNERI